MEWVGIVTMVLEMVQRCRETRSQDLVLADALNRPLGRWMIRAELKNNGVTGRELLAAMYKVRHHDMDDDDIRDFIANATDKGAKPSVEAGAMGALAV